MTTSDPSASAVATAPHALKNRTFLEFWIGSSISFFGDQFYFVALPWLVLRVANSALSLGTVLMVAAIPRAAFMLMGGALSDRISLRTILILTSIGRTALVSVVSALIWSHGIDLWQIYALSFCFGLADAFSFPATQALIPSLVAAEQLPAANSAIMMSAQVSAMVAPACAGITIKAWGVASAFFFDAVSFLFLLLPLVRLPEKHVPVRTAQKGTLHAIVEGLKYVAADPPLRALMILGAGLNLAFSGTITVGLAALAKSRFASAAAYGTLLSALSLGGLLGTFLPGIVKHPSRRGASVLLASFSLGIGMVMIGFLHHLLPIVIVLAVMGFVGGYAEVNLAAWFQRHVSRVLLGRVMSVMMFSAVGLVPISLVVAGALTQISIEAMFLASGATILLVATLAALNADVGSIH